jgi:hypothetical protein
MPNPVRIYVLHHPKSEVAAKLTDRIYDWFRLPSREGIPVYVRSAPEAEKDRPAMPARAPGEECLEYIVPLVDAHMVRDPVWHDYLRDIVKCAESEAENETQRMWGWKLFPVALDSTAFNLPAGVTRMNFIRHGVGQPPKVAVPEHPTPDEKKALDEYHSKETEETLKHLTEALAHDLNKRLFEKKAERFQIFISYARADGTDVPKALRNYIQGNTQCLVFFDENNIGFGQAFGKSIKSNVRGAMIVVNGDNYAERPWCRWEIQRFTEPRLLKLPPPKVGTANARQSMKVFQPVLVVDTTSGPKMSRIVPELAQAPVVRWKEDREMACFSALMREVVFGLREVMVAQTMTWGDLKSESAVVVNRLPGPVALAGLQTGPESPGGSGIITLHHPGHGLPLAELRLLERTFPRVRFKGFQDIESRTSSELKRAHREFEKAAREDSAAPLERKVIALSMAYHCEDLAALGYLPQHQDEALIYLLRPLVRLGVDLIYGGTPPQREPSSGTGVELMADRNITLTLLQLLSDERQVVEIDPSGNSDIPDSAQTSLLFNLSGWPQCESVTAADEATWINLCRIKRIMPADAGLPEWPGKTHEESDLPNPKPKPGFRRYRAKILSRMRQILADGFACPVPGALQRHVKPTAFVFVGGATDKFNGVMPGVMEEFLRAIQAKPAVPIYLMGGLGGATGVIARALLKGKCPPELTQGHYQKAQNAHEYRALLDELTDAERQEITRDFGKLWKIIQSGKGRLGAFFSNGLDDPENEELLETPDTSRAVELIWNGMSRVFLAEQAARSSPQPAAKKKSARSRRSPGK